MDRRARYARLLCRVSFLVPFLAFEVDLEDVHSVLFFFFFLIFFLPFMLPAGI